MKAANQLPRVILLVVVGAALLGGLGSGLARLGWQMGAFSRSAMIVHGPLMIGGFLGTLIALERAAALAGRARWAVAVPIVNAAAAVALLLAQDRLLAKALLTLGSLGLVALFVLMLRLHPSRDVAVMAVGAAFWLLGNALWLAGWQVFQVVHLWAAFLILTIVGERLELSRVRRLSRASEYALLAAIGVYSLGSVLTVANLDVGVRLLGGGAILMAGWLLQNDIARRTIRQRGLVRYIAACLLIGYVWLGVGGALAIWKGAVYAGPDYAAVLHAFLLGFVFSMIFGHMPIILPALTGIQIDYHPAFYLPLVLLHAGLAMRMVGSLGLNFAARQWGAMLNAVAILLFLLMTLVTLLGPRVWRRVRGAPAAP